MTGKLKVGVVGMGRRYRNTYAPILDVLHDQLEVVGLCSRRPGGTRETFGRIDAAVFPSAEDLVSRAKPDFLIVCVSNPVNGPVGRELAQLGVPLFLETPIANELENADAIIRAGRENGFPIEVAEQFHRHPAEQIKRRLIREGVFGRVHAACNDFVVNGYHGVSLLRSYLGFDRRVARVQAVRGEIPLSRDGAETWETGAIVMDDGTVGTFLLSSTCYASEIRRRRITRFYGEGGYSEGDDLFILAEDGKNKTPISWERKITMRNGEKALDAVVAHTRPEVVWENPLKDYAFPDEDQLAVGLCIRSLTNALLNGGPPDYGPLQARLDNEATLALEESIRRQGTPVDLACGDPKGPASSARGRLPSPAGTKG